MALPASFDITSTVDLQEVDNAVNQARKEIAQRYDFKGSKAAIEFNRGDGSLVLVADDEFKMNAVWEVLQTRLVRRGVPIKNIRLDQQPYWHVERARIEGSRKVPVELVVNGHAVARQEITADGKPVELTFDYTPERSSWIALRVFPSSHTNPIFVEVDGQPIRASKRSAQWCLDAVETCWKQKVKQTREHEKAAARAAYDVARDAYARILAEAHDDR